MEGATVEVTRATIPGNREISGPGIVTEMMTAASGMAVVERERRIGVISHGRWRWKRRRSDDAMLRRMGNNLWNT